MTNVGSGFDPSLVHVTGIVNGSPGDTMYRGAGEEKCTQCALLHLCMCVVNSINILRDVTITA